MRAEPPFASGWVRFDSRSTLTIIHIMDTLVKYPLDFSIQNMDTGSREDKTSRETPIDVCKVPLDVDAAEGQQEPA